MTTQSSSDMKQDELTICKAFIRCSASESILGRASALMETKGFSESGLLSRGRESSRVKIVEVEDGGWRKESVERKMESER